MARRLVLPDRQCPDCAPHGNRFMKHVRTETERTRVRYSGTTDTIEHIAFFRCLNCGTTRTEIFDPQNPPRD